MEENVARRRVFQVIKALAFCHANSVRMSINVAFSLSEKVQSKAIFFWIAEASLSCLLF
jgi:hypothetical protein